MKKEIVAIHFDIYIPFGSPLTSHVKKLPDITTKKELVRNYNKVKKLCSKLKILNKLNRINIMVEEKCPYCKEITCKYYSLRRLKELFKHKLIKLPKKKKNEQY